MDDHTQSPIGPEWELLDRYHAGEATAAEVAQVEAYLAEHPHARRALAAVTEAVRGQDAHATPAPVQRMLAAMHERIARTTVLRRLTGKRHEGRLDHAIAALLNVEDAALSPDEARELQKLIDAAKEEGR